PLSSMYALLLLLLRPPPRSPLFPYMTLFRSRCRIDHRCERWRDPWCDGHAHERRASDVRHRGHERVGPVRQRAPPARHLLAESRSEEHTSELQSLRHLVCRLLLEKKKKKKK